jgi:hypothetical protein
MIFMDSLPSLQASLRSSVQEITENDIGEETSMIINNTLESLRQSLQDRDRPNTDEGTAKQGEKSQQSKEPGPAEPQEQLRQSTIRPPMSFSPGRSLSARWLQSPRRMGSPLRHEVLKSSVRESPAAPEYRGSPLASQRQDLSHLENEESNLYDDSFSEIPDVVLEAATPRRPRAAAKDLLSESNDVEMEDAQLIQLEEEADEPEQQEDEQVPQGHEDQEDQEEREEQAEQEEEVGPPTASNVSAVSRSDAGRLPTPDDTPPNIEVGSDNVQKSTGVSQSSARSASSRGSSLKNSSPAPETQAQIEPEVIEEAPETVDDEPVNEDNELMMDDVGVSLQEPDDHSDLEDHILEETLIEHPEEEEGQEEEHEGEEALPEAPAPQKARLSLETENQQAEVTPLNQLTSPIQEHVTLPEMVSERASRPTLSPIVRAGRALQSVTSDPPSPEARDHHLRSPFRRSATRELGPRETQSNRRTSASPGKSRAFPDAGQIPQDNEIYDDPFGTHTRHTGQSSFMEALERSSRGSSPRHRRTASRESIASSIRFQGPSEGGMSWVDNEGPISDNLRGDVPLEAFARSTARHPKSPSISHGQMDGTVDDADDETEDAGDDMDLWEFEAERSIAQSTRQPPTERKPESPVHRRSNIPSSWRRQPTRETQPAASVEHQTRSEIEEVEESVDEEIAPQAEPMETTHEEPSQAEEYSLVTNKEAAQEANKAPASAKPTRFDLSTFFSSPAAFPGMLAEKLSPLKKMSGFGTRPAEPEPVEMEQTLPTSSMFPQVPQHELAPRVQPRAGFFSPIRPVQPALRREVSEEPERELRSRSNSRSHKTSSSGRSGVSARQEEHDVSVQEMSEQQQESEQQEDTEQEEPDELDEAEEVEEPEDLEDLEETQAAESLPSVPQKVNFTPQRRQPRQSFFKTSTQAAAPAAAPAPAPILATGAPTPPRMQLTHADIHKWQQQTSNASDDSPERPPARPILRPLPPKNASPYKSSLRSPLKPHTPGRVVEFTSSVLSPVEQAKVRHQRRLSNSSAASQSSAGVQRPRLGPPPRQTANKENNTLQEVPVSKIGLPIKQPRPEPLSQTVWTRKHWLLLDDLLQQRRQGPFRLNFERYSDKFLGKTVMSHGEAMTLERWHLDCVDAFKTQIGGWDEAALAKRLFALIIGEQRRNREGAAKPARVMFH